MIRTLTDNLPEYDLAIIGAGPAGLTIANELATSGLKVCVLESGSDKKTDFADALKHVEVEGLPIKPESRERLLGGASSTWNALSAPLDEIDFESRTWTPGWPVSRAEMVPYWAKAERYQFPAWDEFADGKTSHEGGLLWENLSAKKFIMPLPNYRFALLRPIFDRENVDLILQATVVQLVKEGGRVPHVRCKTHGGAEYVVRARTFVLACGGIENPRLLLNSHVGNEHNQIGCYFTAHPKGYTGYLRLSRPLPAQSLYLPQTEGTRMQYLGLRLSDEYQRTHGLLNSYVGFEPSYGRLERYAFAIWQRMPNLSTSLMRTLMRPRKLRLRWFVDMEPRAENRVVLSERRDAFGVPLAKVVHMLGERDRATLAALWEELTHNVERLHLGRVEGSVQEVISNARADASHHLGATRMGVDPATSVVDATCRVHGVANLYIAGSSVFTSAGCANPTMTIVALAIRLAEHLQSTLSVR